MVECPNHGGAFDCTPFCNLCEGNQEMRLYAREPLQRLLEMVAVLRQDQVDMVSIGYHKIAKQDQKVIDAMMAEIEWREIKEKR